MTLNKRMDELNKMIEQLQEDVQAFAKHDAMSEKDALRMYTEMAAIRSNMQCAVMIAEQLERSTEAIQSLERVVKTLR